MKNGKFLAITLPIMVLLPGAIIGTNVAANLWSQSLDTYLGRGNHVVVNVEGTIDQNS